MRKTFTPIFVILLCVLSPICLRAQSLPKISLSIGPELGIPFGGKTDSYADGIRTWYKDGGGGSIKAEFLLGHGVSLTASAGFIHYGTGEFYVYETAHPPIGFPTSAQNYPQASPYNFVPLKGGLRYSFVKILYITGEAGDALKASKTAVGNFIYSGGAGVIIPISLHHSIDASVRYENGYKITDYDGTMHEVALRLAYRFSL